MKHYFQLILSLFHLYAFSQEQKIHISANVVNAEKQPVEFASITLTSREWGTITNNKGEFTLNNIYIYDSVKISAIAYQATILCVKDILNQDTVTLKRKITTLPAVTVATIRIKGESTELGFFNQKNNGAYISWHPGAQLAVFIENKKSIRGYMSAIRFKLKNIYSCSFPLRIRLMNMDKINGGPGEDMLYENLILYPEFFKRKNSIDIRQYNIQTPQEGMFVVLECLHNIQCKTPKPPEIVANINTPKNVVWHNYRDRKWSRLRNEPLAVNGNYMTPNISVKITY